MPKLTIAGILQDYDEEAYYEIEIVGLNASKKARTRVQAQAGQFSFEVSEGHQQDWFAGRPATFFFRVYRNNSLVLSTEERLHATLRNNRVVIPLRCHLPLIPDARAKVCGTITDCRGTPIRGLLVSAYDQDLQHVGPGKGTPKKPAGPGQFLGEALTNECGKYCIPYTRKAYSQFEIASADLIVAVRQPRGQKILAKSRTRFNAPPKATVDLRVSGLNYPARHEFLVYTEALTRLGAKSPAARAGLTDERFDFVVAEAGIDREHLRLLTLAYRTARRNAPDVRADEVAEWVYGLLRRGISSEFESWPRRYTTKDLRTRFSEAVGSCVISLRPDPDFSAAAAELLLWALFRFLEQPIKGRRSSWKELLEIITPATDGTLYVWGAAFIRHGVSDGLWEELRASALFAVVNDLERLVDLARIGGFHAQAVAKFFRDEDALIDSSAAGEPTWTDYLRPIGPPADASLEDYALEVLQNAQAFYGSSRATNWFANVGFGIMPDLAGAEALLAAADFDLNSANLLGDEYLGRLAGTDDEKQRTLLALRSAQRLGRLTTSEQVAEKLVSAGFDSARSIAAHTFTDFVGKVGVGSIGEMASTYAKARETTSLALASRLQLSPVLNGASPYATTPDLTNTDLPAAGQSALLGAGGLCECEGRESVFSPAAYLYDLVRFARQNPQADALLTSRRPDIFSVQLSHRNTFTALPAIDLVNELLEDLVADHLGVTKLVARQTTLEAAELELTPEHENSEVYTALNLPERHRPWILPFDLNHQRQSALLDAVGLERTEILRLTGQLETWSYASLGVSESQLTLLTSPTTLIEAYGNVPLVELRKAPVLMAKTQLGFQDLHALTQLRVLSSDLGALVVTPELDPSDGLPLHQCDPAQVRIDGLTEAHLQRIHAFVRLWRATGWRVFDLARAIETLHPAATAEGGLPASSPLGDRTFLDRLGTAEMIRKRLKLTPEELLCFWSSVPTSRWEPPFVRAEVVPSLWDRLFQVPVGELTLAATANAARVSAAFAASMLIDGVMDAAFASELYAYGLLGQKLRGVRPEDLRYLQQLRSAGGYAEPIFSSPTSTWAALEVLEGVRRSGARLGETWPLYVVAESSAERTRSWASLQTMAAAAVLREGPLRAFDLDGKLHPALLHFMPEATATAVVTALSPANPGLTVDATVSGLIGIDGLNLANEAAAARPRKILAELAKRRWHENVIAELVRDTKLAKEVVTAIAESVQISNGETIVAQLERWVGDGGTWTSTDASAVTPAQQLDFNERGLLRLGVAVSAALDAFVLTVEPGAYELRVTAVFDVTAVLGGTAPQLRAGLFGELVNAPPLISNVPALAFSFQVEAQSAVARRLVVEFSTSVAATFLLELVCPGTGGIALSTFHLFSSGDAFLATVEALEVGRVTAKLAKTWKLTANDVVALRELAANNPDFPRFPPLGSPRPFASPAFAPGPDPAPIATDDTLGFERWLSFAGLATALQLASASRTALFDAVRLAQAGAPDDEVWAALARAFGVTSASMQSAAGELHLMGSDVAVARDLVALVDLSRAIDLHGVSAERFESWGSPASTASDVTALAAAARSQLVGSATGRERLLKAANRIRKAKRDAMVAYLLEFPPAGTSWNLPKEISDYVLSDVEMEPCARTSRTRDGIDAIQRLLQQIATGKLPAIRLTRGQTDEWQVMGRYPLWEVRRKILLYPENWLRFGKHLHRSPEYEELERSLLQGDLTLDQGQEAIERYVERLHAIGHLEVVGTCVEQEVDLTGALCVDRLHVVARSPAEPREYYHRELIDQAFWTPWKKIELDVDSDQIIPFVHNRRLHLFWPIFETVPQEDAIREDSRKFKFEDSFLTMRLAWSVLTTKGWAAKRIGKSEFSTRFNYFAAARAESGFYGRVYVEVRGWHQTLQEPGKFEFRPTIGEQGDIVIELYVQLQTTSLVNLDTDYASWIFTLGVQDEWEDYADDVRDDTLDELADDLRDEVSPVYPARPSLNDDTDGPETNTSGDAVLCGLFRLTPDNLVEMTTWDELEPALRNQSPQELQKSSPKDGAYEYWDSSVELYASGSFRTILDDVGIPNRVVITRQEATPTREHPVFLRIQNRAFFGWKHYDRLPPASTPWDPKSKATDLTKQHAIAMDVVKAKKSLKLVETGPQTLKGDLVKSTRLATPVDFSSTGAWYFALAHHPHTIELLRAARAGLPKLFHRELQVDPRENTSSLTQPLDFESYGPRAAWIVKPYPKDELQFTADGSYSGYNWELLFHAPMAVAEQLMRVGRFADAKRWLKFVFDPEDPDGSTDVATYWTFRPFVLLTEEGGTGDFDALSPTGDGSEHKKRVFRGLIKQWRQNPFNPHAIAVFRIQAYQLAAIFLYVENLVAWGDSLFAQPSPELVAQAARLYEEAERIIGRAPRSTGAIRHDRLAKSISDIGSAPTADELENAFSIGDAAAPLLEDDFLPDFALHYFCLPPNPKVGDLRRKVQDRLFKVHHCLDLQGNPRTLPLFDPPIDPQLLADAAMAGLDVSSIVMSGYVPRPHYRFRTLLELAVSFTNEVKSLGAGLLSALEKRDAEQLNALRSRNEMHVLDRATAIRRLQTEETEASIKVLEGTRTGVEFRQQFYAQREFMNAEENAQIVLSIASSLFQVIGQAMGSASSAAGAFPDITIGAAGWAASPVTVTMTGGGNASRVLSGLGTAMTAASGVLGTMASISGTMGGYRRRQEEWDFQVESAKLELKQLNAQIIGGQIRKAIAQRELANHEAQVRETREVEEFVRSKQTSVDLYEWLASEVSASYRQVFDLARSLALQAQRAMHEELGIGDQFIGHAQWDAGHSGLMAGERLLGDLLEMRATYHRLNARPVYKTVDVSLARLNPLALAELKVKGTCNFELEERFWDAIAPGQYFRRIRRLSISVPAIVGPFTGLHGRLSVRRASYRQDPRLLNDEYLRQGSSDPRFVEQFARPGDVIALSTGQRDTGMSPDDEREDRYYPFEYLGVESDWTLDIPHADNRLDPSTISDVILHVEYTSREGGDELLQEARQAAQEDTHDNVTFSVRNEFARDWARRAEGAVLAIDLSRVLPKFSETHASAPLNEVTVVVLLHAKARPGSVINVEVRPPWDDSVAWAGPVTWGNGPESRLGFVAVTLPNTAVPDPLNVNVGDLTGTWTVTEPTGVDLDDLLLAIAWR
jgi:hypothetical protein